MSGNDIKGIAQDIPKN